MSKFDRSITWTVMNEAMLRFPNEACGLIVQIGNRSVAIPCKNVSPEPHDRFSISAEEFAKAEDKGEVIAVWHTHVNGDPTPSETDIHACNNTGLPWYIVGVSKSPDSESEFRFSETYELLPDNAPLPYVGRPYIYGVHDCFTLMVDYYKREFGISMPHIVGNYFDDNDWARRKERLLEDNFEKNGFVRLANQQPIVGDVFLIQLCADIANHIAIYVGDNRILHHCEGRVSEFSIYGGGYWQKHTAHHLRHKLRHEQ